VWGKTKNARSTAQETAKNWKTDSSESISSFKSKARKTNSSARTTLQFLNFPFPPPHTKNKNSAETNNQITTQNNVRHNSHKRKRGGKKTAIKFCIEKSLCFSHRQRQQSHKAEQRSVHNAVGVENECITTSYYNSGGTRRQKLLPLARTIDSTAATTATECRVMSSHKSRNQTTLLLLLLLSSSSCTS